MRRLVLTVIVLAACVAAMRAQEAPKTKPVPETLTADAKLHAQAATIWDLLKQNAQLRAQLADAIARLDSAALTEQGAKLQAERDRLEREFRKAVGAPDTASVDWSKSPPLVVWPDKDARQ